MTGGTLSMLAEQGEEMKEQLIAVRRDFHMNPELSFEEARTAGIVAETLRELGLSVKTNVGGHGVVADVHGVAEGRTVALRADMDALPIQEETELPFASRTPGVMHACGHDAHTAMLLGAARLLCRHRDRLRGTVRLIFQSAEEITAGAKAMIAEGVLDGVDEIYGLHNLPSLEAGRAATRHGAMMASADTLEIVIEGKGGHGAMPDQTVDPIVAASAVVMGLQTAVSREISPFEPVVVTIGSFQGGHAFNVIPPKVHLSGTVRTFSPRVHAGMAERIERIVSRISEGYRCRATVTHIPQVPVLAGDNACTDHMNRTVDRVIGADKRKEAAPTMGSEDFAVFLEHVPGCFFWLGSGPAEDAGRAYGLHHPRFTINEDCLGTGAALLAGIAMDRLGPEADSGKNANE